MPDSSQPVGHHAPSPASGHLFRDDLVRLPDSTLAFVDRLPGHSSDSDSDSSESESDVDSESLTDSRGRVTRLTGLPILPNASESRHPVLHTPRANRPSLITTYDDPSGGAADAHDSEPRVGSPPLSRSRADTASVPTDGQNDADPSSGSRRQRQPVPDGSALVANSLSAEQTVLPTSDLTPIDRSFDPGALVLPMQHGPSAQSGLIERVRKTLVVRRVTGITPATTLSPDPSSLFEVPAESLGFFCGLRSGDTVVRGPWVGVVDYFQEDVYVQFSDGAIACVPGTDSALQNIDPRTPNRVKPDPFSEGLYYPGQRVRSLPSILRSLAVWIRGRYTGVDEGIVKSVSVGDVGVEWVAHSMHASNSEKTQLPSNEERGVQVVKFSDITLLEAFRSMWWTVGDRGYLRKSGRSGSQIDGSDQLPSDCEDCDADGEWEEDVNSLHDDADDSSDPSQGNVSSPRFSSNNRSRNRSGRLMKAQRRARERGLGNSSVSSVNESLLTNSSVEPSDVVQVVATKTTIDVLWQDGSRNENLPSLDFRVHLHPDPYDFWPGELVFKSNNTPGEVPPSIPNGNHSLHLQQPQNFGRPGALVRMNQAERTAIVRWMDPDSGEFGEEEEVSVYDLNGDHFDINIGDTVLHVPKDSSSTDDRKDWVGVVVGQRVGKCTVSWHGGKVSDVPYSELLLFLSSDEDEESYESGDSSADEDGNGRRRAEWHIGMSRDDSREDADDVDRELRRNWGTDDEEESGQPVSPLESLTRLLHTLIRDAAKLRYGINFAGTNVARAVASAREYVLRNPPAELASRENGERPALTVELARALGGMLFYQSLSRLLAFERSPAESRSGASEDASNTSEAWEDFGFALQAAFKDTVEELGATTDFHNGLTSSGSHHGSDGTEANREVSRDTPESETRNAMETEKTRESGVDQSANIERFEMVEDLPDFHANTKPGPAGPTHNPGLLPVVNREWRRLRKNLPPGIMVRVAEKHHERMRAFIVGPEDTPYADVLFFFDILMGPRYPNEPPLVRFHAYGRRLNPNLYADGTVCLSILGTWDGDVVESWDPKNSNLLRVLLSLQAMVFVEEPYFNEAGYQKQRGTEEGRKNSQTYNESALLLSLKHALHCLSVVLASDVDDLVKEHYRAVGPKIIERCNRLLGSGHSGPNGSASEKAPAVRPGMSAGFRRSLQQLIPSLQKVFNDLKENEMRD